MTSSKNGLVITIVVVFAVVAGVGFGLKFLIGQLSQVIQKTRDEEEAQTEEASNNATADSEAAPAEPAQAS